MCGCARVSIKSNSRTKEGLAASLSELITTCNNLKDGAEKERNKLQAAADAKDKLIEVKLYRNAKYYKYY